jgi:hypothetical protein
MMFEHWQRYLSLLSYRCQVSDSQDLCYDQHAQFDALEARLKRREPAFMDVHFAPPVTVPPVIANGNFSSSLSFHNLDWDGEVYDSDSRDPTRPLQV